MPIAYNRIAIAALDESNILDAEARGQFECKPHKRSKRNANLADYRTGAFCIAFPMTSKNKESKKKLCYRIWYRDDSLKIKFKELSEHVSRNELYRKLPYFVYYQYISKAIRVEGNELPGVKMEWVEGSCLHEWLGGNRNRLAVSQLSAAFMKMCKDLANIGVAHGDLSNANIIVTEKGEIRLVDYDSVYTPSMRDDFYQTTAGQDAFQHPERLDGKLLKMSKNDDNFSQQVIYLSLLAMSYDVSLIDWISESELLFTKDDLSSESNFVHSRAYQELSSMNVPEITARLSELRSAIKGPLSDVRSIVDFHIVQEKRYVEYCHICGHKYPNATDLYCTQCGTARLVYQKK